MDVSVIIVNYNTLQMTQECIDSIFEKTKGVDFEVILVDNASTDGSREHFENEKRIKYIYNELNLGFGRANNLGFEYATGNYIFFLNSDTLLLNNAIYEFFIYMESHSSDIGCVGCELQDQSGKLSYSFSTFPNLVFFIGMVLKVYHIKSSSFFPPNKFEGKHPIIVDYTSGADMFVRRYVLDTCGLFDKDFFMYFEEVEMQNRFKDKGYASHIIDTPKIIHLLGGSEKKRSKNRLPINKIELESRYIYCRKIFSRSKYLLMSFFNLFLIPRILFSGSVWKDKKLMIYIILWNFFPNNNVSIFYNQSPR